MTVGQVTLLWTTLTSMREHVEDHSCVTLRTGCVHSNKDLVTPSTGTGPEAKPPASALDLRLIIHLELLRVRVALTDP